MGKVKNYYSYEVGGRMFYIGEEPPTPTTVYIVGYISSVEFVCLGVFCKKEVAEYVKLKHDETTDKDHRKAFINKEHLK